MLKRRPEKSKRRSEKSKRFWRNRYLSKALRSRPQGRPVATVIWTAPPAPETLPGAKVIIDCLPQRASLFDIYLRKTHAAVVALSDLGQTEARKPGREFQCY